MITIESISKSFGGQILFHNAGFQINTGEKIGLVGRNGHGKTTLLKVITGEEEPDTGAVRIPNGYRLGYLTQHINFSEDQVIKECMKGLPESEKDHYWKAEKILAGLGFLNGEMEMHPDEFSGGFQVRLNLAKILVSDPDLLILDEPTNYLDITSIRWISGFLSSWPREILLVTHDRSFMDRVVTHIAGIHRHTVRKIKGNTGKYYARIAQDEEIYEKTRVNEEKRRKDMETFITRFRAKARLAGLVQSRIKALEKMGKKENLHKLESLEFSFQDLVFSGKQVITAENLCFSYDREEKLIENFNFTLFPKDRVAIIGKNGKGKTTLLKLLSQNLKPVSGEVRYNPGVEPGYFEQTNIQSLNANLTIEEEILYSNGDLDRQQARNICGAMMFEGDNALKRISVLSGGEKSRVMLAKLLAEPLNLLLLDEPTNHLDMESSDSLVAALDNFAGSVILVTHNELFLYSLANRLIVFKDNTIKVFEGTYEEFLEKEGWGDNKRAVENTLNKAEKNFSHTERSSESKFSGRSDNKGQVLQKGKKGQLKNKGNGNGVQDGVKLSRKEIRKKRSEIIAQRSRVLNPLKKKIDRTEHKIDSLEKEMKNLNVELQESVTAGNGKEIASLSRKIAEIQKEIDILFDDLENFMDEFDKKKLMFEEKFNE